MPAERQECFVLPPKPEKLELIEIAHELLARRGFELIYMKRYPFGPDTPWIVNDAMVFQRAAFPEPNLRRRLGAARRLLTRRA